MSKVKILSYTKNPLLAIINAIRTCKRSEDRSESYVGLEGNEVIAGKDLNLIKTCIDSGHHSILEFVDFTFELNLSKVAHTQLVRHRMSTFAAESQRSVTPGDFVMPDGITPEFQLKFQEFCQYCFDFYREMKDAGVAGEAARYALPQAFSGKIIYKANLRSLRNAIAERCCVSANEEIRKVFWVIREIVHDIHPVLVRKSAKYHHCDKRDNCGYCLNGLEGLDL